MTNSKMKTIDMNEVKQLKKQLDARVRKGRGGYSPYRTIATKLRYSEPEGFRFVKDFFSGKIKYPKVQHYKMLMYARQIVNSKITNPYLAEFIELDD